MPRALPGLALLLAIALPLQARNVIAASNGLLQVRTAEVCFAVHVGGSPTRVFGTRYSTHSSDLSRVILLVHGHSNTRHFWDWTPDFSIARLLARAGYLVVAYDRLTSGESTYPAAPEDPSSTQANAITFADHRAMIAEVVQQIRGTYKLPRTDCPPSTSVGAAAQSKIVLIGHSSGAALASGYAAEWNATAPINAMVQLAWSNQGWSDYAQTAVSGAFADQANVNARQLSVFLDPGSTRRSRSISAERCQSNVHLLLYQGMPTRPDLSAPVCDPATFETEPYAGLGTVAGASAKNRALIPFTPADLPVMLTWTDHDGFFPTDPSLSTASAGANDCGPLGCQGAEDLLWQTAHPGHVSIWTAKNCGHHIAACTSMPDWVAAVEKWLKTNGLSVNKLQDEATVDPHLGRIFLEP